MTMLKTLSFLCVVLSALVIFADDPEIITEENGFTLKPSVLWMPSPTSCEDSEATCESKMNPYTEQAVDPETAFDMVPIPGGRFMMGSPESEVNRREDEGPQVEMRIRPFWMGRCEVTWDEIREFSNPQDPEEKRPALSENATEYERLAEQVIEASRIRVGCRFAPPSYLFKDYLDEDGEPVVCISQRFARAYCIWLTARTGRYYRLPTEAEWEYACRAGTTTAYSFGDNSDKIGEYCWYWDEEARKGNEYDDEESLPVGSLKPNPWGLYDMHGNVSEWCLDAYVENRYQLLQDGGVEVRREFVVPALSTYLPRSETYHTSCVVRGGSWWDLPENCRSASRSNEDETAPSNEDWNERDPCVPQGDDWYSDSCWTGFRVVRPLKTPTIEQSRRYEKGADSTVYRGLYNRGEEGEYERQWGRYD